MILDHNDEVVGFTDYRLWSWWILGGSDIKNHISSMWRDLGDSFNDEARAYFYGRRDARNEELVRAFR